ncbi:unnamed protein product [Colias eurytheme]|nr:unnamed protein product [Colias eurytheme]
MRVSHDTVLLHATLLQDKDDLVVSLSSKIKKPADAIAKHVMETLKGLPGNLTASSTHSTKESDGARLPSAVSFSRPCWKKYRFKKSR